MHDEAATHYVDMIDQTTLGHRYIKERFGKTPALVGRLILLVLPPSKLTSAVPRLKSS